MFVAVIRIVRTSAISHSGPSTQRCRMLAPATASNPTTITQKYQYSQPLVKPAPSPSERRMSSVNEPSFGMSGGHLAEHSHHKHDQDAREHIGAHRRQAGHADHGTRADEQPGPDHASQRDHGQMALERAPAGARPLSSGGVARFGAVVIDMLGSRRLRSTLTAMRSHATPPEVWSRNRRPAEA